jgi:hypothetical protein
MLETITLASAHPVLYRGAAPTLHPLGSRWIPGEGCGIGRQRATGALFEDCCTSITDGRSGLVEADHSK